MNIIDVLNARKAKLFEASNDIRKKISEIIDENSFVELKAYSFAKNEFYNEDVDGLGVVTGYARIDDNPVYVIAQNSKVLNGGLSKANCEKITECLVKAGDSNTPVIYLLDSQGVQVGEGVGVMEGIASVLSVASELKGVVPQFAVAIGDVFGSLSLLTALCDYTFVVGASATCYTSPAVISASTKDGISKEVLGGAKAENGLVSFAVKTLDEVKENIIKILSILPDYSSLVEDSSDDLNRASAILNTKKDVTTLTTALFDKGSYVELNKNFASEVKTGIARIGGISVASIIFDGGENGVELTLSNVIKIKNFAKYVNDNSLPLVNLINVKGIKQDAETCKSPVIIEMANMLGELAKNYIVSVVYGKAIGLGYTSFVSKEFGVKYSFAFCDSKISLLDGESGIAVEFGTIDSEKIDTLKEEYEGKQDAMNSARLGCVDNVIEPQFIRQYVISALQMVIRN